MFYDLWSLELSIDFALSLDWVVGLVGVVGVGGVDWVVGLVGVVGMVGVVGLVGWLGWWGWFGEKANDHLKKKEKSTTRPAQLVKKASLGGALSASPRNSPTLANLLRD